MATLALVDATTYVDDYDFTTDLSSVKLEAAAEELDSTTFGGGGFRSRTAGLKTVGGEVAGYWQATPDAAAFTNLGTANRVVTHTLTGVAGDVAYMYQAGKFKYEAFGTVGELTPFTLTMNGTDGTAGLVRGQLAKAKGNVSATGVLGSVLNLGAPTATQYVYCAVHIFSAGTTITLQLQSDTASNFPSATTQATIGPLTTAGGTWMTRVAGALAGETHWRLNVSAITGTFSIAAAIAVQ